MPLIIRNIPDNESWKALQNWKIEWKTKNNKNKIAKSSILHTLKQRMFKVLINLLTYSLTHLLTRIVGGRGRWRLQGQVQNEALYRIFREQHRRQVNNLLTYSLTHSLTHLLTHSLTHSLTYSPSPLYIFDSNYDNDAVSKCLLEDYRVPSYFPEDLFSLVNLLITLLTHSYTQLTHAY